MLQQFTRRFTSTGRNMARCIALAVVMFATTAQAQPASSDDDWKQTVIIYLLAPTISGTAGVGPADADLDVDPGTVFETLDGAFLGMYHAEKDRWGVLLDIVYMDLVSDLELPGGHLSGEFENEQLITMLAATHRLDEHWQLVGGLAYTEVDMRLDLRGPLQNRSAGRDENWIDPFVGAIWSTQVASNWQFSSYGLVGGFGVGSDLLWSLNAEFSWRFGEHTSLVLGARYIDYDYEDGSGANRFKFDIAEYGPALGFRWDF
jgi:hypothetical protein